MSEEFIPGQTQGYRIAGGFDCEPELETYTFREFTDTGNFSFRDNKTHRKFQCSRDWFFITEREAWQNYMLELAKGVESIDEQITKLTEDKKEAQRRFFETHNRINPNQKIQL